jgi:hypothetical protein
MLTQLADALHILERGRRDLAALCIGIAGSDTSIVVQLSCLDSRVVYG